MREIPLTRGMVALVDDADYEIVSRYKWNPKRGRRTWYAQTNFKREDGSWATVQLHRFVMGEPPDGLPEVDHVNGNGLDCRRENMRPTTRSQNAQNQRGAHRDSLTGVRGVCFDRTAGRYKAVVVVNYKAHSLGYHATLAAAEQAAIEGRRRLMTHAPESA